MKRILLVLLIFVACIVTPPPKIYELKCINPSYKSQEFEVFLSKSLYNHDAFLYCAKGRCLSFKVSFIVVHKLKNLDVIKIRDINISSTAINFVPKSVLATKKLFNKTEFFVSSNDTIEFEYLLDPVLKFKELDLYDLKNDTINLSFALNGNDIKFKFIPNWELKL